MRWVVTVAVDVPHMLNTILHQKFVDDLAYANQTVFVSTRDPQKFQLGFGSFDIRNEILCRLGIGCGRKRAYPSKRI